MWTLRPIRVVVRGPAKTRKLALKAKRLVGADGAVLPTDEHKFTIQDTGLIDDTSDNLIYLDAPSVGGVWYEGKLGNDSIKFLLVAGGETTLAALIAAGVVLTDTLEAFVLEQLANLPAGGGTSDYNALTNKPTLGTASAFDLDATHRFTTDLEKSAWNAKQAALNFTPENIANKSTDGTFASNSDTLYPSQKAAKTYVDASIAALVGGSPDSLNALNEFAAALGNDPNFATTVSTSIGGKLAKASNLSDLVNAATARTNLGLNTTANLTDSLNKRFATDAQVAAIAANTSNIAAKVPNSRTITVNGVAKDLTADIEFTVSAAGGAGTGANTFTADQTIQAKLLLQKSGNTTDTAEIYVDTDSGNVGTRALYILPAVPGERIRFGTSARPIGNLSLQNVGNIEGMPKFTTPDQMSYSESGASHNIHRSGVSVIVAASDNNGNAKIRLATGGASYGTYSDRFVIDANGNFQFWNGGTLKAASFVDPTAIPTGKKVLVIDA